MECSVPSLSYGVFSRMLQFAFDTCSLLSHRGFYPLTQEANLITSLLVTA